MTNKDHQKLIYNVVFKIELYLKADKASGMD